MSGTAVASDEQLITHIGALLKAYQGEVDILTKRARNFEWALGYVTPWIKSTLDAPSPAPVASPAAPPSDVLSKLHLQIEALNETLEDKEVQAQLLRAERDKAAASLQAGASYCITLACSHSMFLSFCS